jgi:DNA (cytosine-5)-methyltransferase 1
VAELGYHLDALAVDAKHFVPQSRPRLFIVGTLPEKTPSDVLRGDAWAAEASRRKGAVSRKLYDAMRTTELPTGWVAHRLPQLPPVKNNLAALISTDDAQQWWGGDEVEKHLRRTSEAHHADMERLRRSGETWVGTGFRRIREGTTRVEVRFDGLAGCLRTAQGGSARQIVVLIHDRQIKMRWMTPREYARLQGAPNFNITRGINQSLTGFGDGVCVPVIEWVDANILTRVHDGVTATRPQASPDAPRAQVGLL